MNSFYTQFRGDKIWNHVFYPTPLVALEVSNKEGAAIDTVFFPPSVCMPNPWKIQKYYFLPMGLREHLEWCGTTCSDIEAHKVHFLAKMIKMSLVNLGLTKGQTRSEYTQNNTFHSFSSSQSFSEIFSHFVQV